MVTSRIDPPAAEEECWGRELYGESMVGYLPTLHLVGGL